MKNILVTGNEGYIGCILTEKLLEKRYEVIGFDSGIFKDAAFVSKKNKPTKQIYKDIRDIEIADLRGVDAVIHLAGLSNDPVGYVNPQLTHQINFEASVKLAELSKSLGIERFLFSSSCSMYGISGQEFVSESSVLNPQTPYAKAKAMVEEEVSKLADDKFCPIFLRNSTVFGISPRMRMDLVVQNLVAYGYLFNVITILSDGSPWRPLIHINDLVEAFCFLLEFPKGKVDNQTFNIGKKENNIQIKTIAEMIKSVIPNTKIEIKNENPSDARSYKVDFSKIYSLGFTPQFTVLDGIKEMYETFKKVNFTKEDFESSDYITLKKYQELIKNGQMDENFRLI